MTNLFRWFHKLKMYGKIMVSFLFAVLLTVIIGAVGAYALYGSGNSKTALILIIITAVSLLLEILVARYISASMGLPIRLSVTVARMLSVGDLDVAEVVKDDHNNERSDEYGEIGQAFDTLISNTQRQVDTAQKLADGDLTVNFDIRSDKDLLGKALCHVVDNLNELTKSIIAASNQVADSAEMLSNSNAQLSEGAAEQASSIQQLTASVEQISAQINSSAKNAEKANTLVTQANEHAESGNRQMNEMLRAMNDISESSRNINKIIKVIDDIAFQTNILALNAAVEAARAGVHGKGFVVVAEEVRNLAAKSAAAAKESTDMIANSLTKVEVGMKIADETASALKAIVDEVNVATGLISSIAVSSEEQVESIKQINMGISQVSQVVQTNAANSEEGAAASQELANQAEMLKSMVGSFKVRQDKTSCIKM